MKAINNDELIKQAVVDFSTRRRTKESSQEPTPQKKDQLEMKAKIEKAKIHAQEEILAFRLIIEEAKAKTKDLALFSESGDIMQSLFIDNILNTIIEPIVKGSPVNYMPPDLYKQMRKEFFKDLIKKYES